jgi:hypothetical protein
MARTVWKENKVISIDTRKGVYVLAQMLKSPYIIVYNIFREKNEWLDVDLEKTPVLCCNSITNQFLKMSNIEPRQIKPAFHMELPKYWIDHFANSRYIDVWKDTPYEKKILIIGEGGALIERDIREGGVYKTKILKSSISFDDNEIIDKYELTNIRIYAEFNERLYLCYKLGKNVDPLKDLIFNRPIPIEYKDYINIISS